MSLRGEIQRFVFHLSLKCMQQLARPDFFLAPSTGLLVVLLQLGQLLILLLLGSASSGSRKRLHASRFFVSVLSRCSSHSSLESSAISGFKTHVHIVANQIWFCIPDMSLSYSFCTWLWATPLQDHTGISSSIQQVQKGSLTPSQPIFLSHLLPLASYLISQSFFNPRQSGICPQHSCTYALGRVANDCLVTKSSVPFQHFSYWLPAVVFLLHKALRSCPFNATPFPCLPVLDYR